MRPEYLLESEIVRCIAEAGELNAALGGADPTPVLKALNKAKVRHVLVGGMAMGALTNKPRATRDVDVVVHPDDLEKAHDALDKAFPELHRTPNPPVGVPDHEDVTRYADPKLDAGPYGHDNDKINVLHPVGLFGHMLTHSQPVTLAGGVKTRVPTRSVMIAAKAYSATSPHRGPEGQARDMADLHGLVAAHLHSGGNIQKAAWHALAIHHDAGRVPEALIRNVSIKHQNLIRDFRAGKGLKIATK